MSWDVLIVLNITTPRLRRKKRAACWQKTKVSRRVRLSVGLYLMKRSYLLTLRAAGGFM